MRKGGFGAGLLIVMRGNPGKIGGSGAVGEGQSSVQEGFSTFVTGSEFSAARVNVCLLESAIAQKLAIATYDERT